jgi:glucosamine--fructose-6-phosphate aminotransferase (isomerizing)
MCGIIGILGRAPAADRLVDSLKRLEYRGYDSAGVATLEDGKVVCVRAEGKLKNLEVKLTENDPLLGCSGIGHTRWATHGKPTENNAHPHGYGVVQVVHNGIISNFRQFRTELEEKGITLDSETDTAVLAPKVDLFLKVGMTPKQAIEALLPQLQGKYALLFMFEGEEDLLIAARNGAPLAIGYGDGEMFVGSDAIALAGLATEMSYLEEGDYAVVTRKGAIIYDKTGKEVKRDRVRNVVTVEFVDKGKFRHFMEKEIHEQPEVVEHTLDRYLNFALGAVMETAGLDVDWTKISHIDMTAAGTASIASRIAKYWFERYARIKVTTDIASEFRYRDSPFLPGSITLVVSQSGETADTLASLEYAQEHGQKVIAVVNVPTSTIARQADYVMPTLAGPEIGVASTKAFTCQLAALASLAIAAGKQRGVIGPELERELVGELAKVPDLLRQALEGKSSIEKIAKRFALDKINDVLYLGRDTSYPLAEEGALKLKEITYIHAEAYAAGELKHGPISLIDEKMPVVFIAPHDEIFEKTFSSMQEVNAKGGKLVLLSDEKGHHDAVIENATIDRVQLPASHRFVSPFVYAVPLQFLAYYTALYMGTDVDQPRNLAKSVTVE